LAKRLAENRKDVVLLLCDATTPMLPCICAPSDLDCEHSLGSILAAIHVTGTLVRQNCMLHKKYKHLAIIAMLKGENEYTYPSYTENQVKELITVLREVAPYVIIDCGSVISSDMLSTISLIESDAVLRLANCNLRSVSYFSSQLPLLKKMKNWDTEKQIKAASNVRICEASENMEQALDGMPFQIPHSDEVEQLVLAGDLFKDLTLRESRSFRKEIEKISKEVFGI
jgi:MinD-like ATPase involved in chromosome partitioning or flagellar assembly